MDTEIDALVSSGGFCTIWRSIIIYVFYTLKDHRVLLDVLGINFVEKKNKEIVVHANILEVNMRLIVPTFNLAVCQTTYIMNARQNMQI